MSSPDTEIIRTLAAYCDNQAIRYLAFLAPTMTEEDRLALIRIIPTAVDTYHAPPVYLSDCTDQDVRTMINHYASIIPSSVRNILGSSWYMTGYLPYDQARDLFTEIRRNDLYIPPEHPAMQFRGNKLARTKLLLTSIGDSMMASKDERRLAGTVGCLPRVRRYKYTGATFYSLELYKPIESFPSIAQLAKRISRDFDMNVNHVIVTSYMHDDFIGAHDDKPVTMADTKPFVVITLGESSRQFVVTRNGDGQEVARITAESGSCLGMSYKDNLRFKHEVVPVKNERGSTRNGRPASERVSIVFREINTVTSVTEFHAKAQKQQSGADERKRAFETYFVVERMIHKEGGPCGTPDRELTRCTTGRNKQFCVLCFPKKKKKK